MSYATPPSNAGRTEPDQVICSAQKCHSHARWAVVWNNPKIHTPDREKIWAACDEHRATLADYLTHHRMNLIRVDAMPEYDDTQSRNDPPSQPPSTTSSPARLIR